MTAFNRSKLGALFITALFFCSIVFAQTSSSILTDNKLQSKLDTAIDHAARIYLHDSNANGISIGVYYRTKKLHLQLR